MVGAPVYLLMKDRPKPARARASSYVASPSAVTHAPNAVRPRANSLSLYAPATPLLRERQAALEDAFAERRPDDSALHTASEPQSTDSLAGGYVDFEGKFEQKRNFVNWMWAEHGQLARSSAPSYNVKISQADRSQNMTVDAIKELKEANITNVLSLNEFELRPEQVDALRKENIGYLWLPVKDFGTPSVAALLQGCEFIRNNSGATLVYCGFGRGRTGVQIAAWEIYNGKDRYTAIHGSSIEKPKQLLALQVMPTREQFPWPHFGRRRYLSVPRT